MASSTTRRRPARDRRPGLGVLVTPFVVFGFSVLAAAFHKWAGEPLGPTAAAKLADLWQTMAMMLVVYTPALGRHQLALRAAQQEPARRALGAGPHLSTLTEEEVADVDPDHGIRRSRRRPVAR